MRQRPPFPIALPWPGDLSNLIVRGIYLDPGLREADPFKRSTSHATSGDAGARAGGPQPPTSAPDSSSSTE